MNGLMWFIYLANVLPGLAVLGGFMVGVSLFLMIFLPTKGVSIFSSDHYPMMGCFRKDVWFLMALGLFLAIATPNQQTIYLMAGAKGAEIAVESEVGKEILLNIKEVIQYQLDDLKKTPLTGGKKYEF